MKTTIEPIKMEQKPVLIRLMELYLYDFSIFSDQDVSEYGCFGYAHIDDYWNEEGRFPYMIRVDGRIAGFALVRSGCEYHDLPDAFNMAEFFVMKKYRRRGIGRCAAERVFDRHRGNWEVTQWSNNLPARNFWNAVIRDYTRGEYTEFGSVEAGHVGLLFNNASRGIDGMEGCF